MSEAIMILAAIETKIKDLRRIYKESKDEIIKESLNKYVQLWNDKNKEYGLKEGYIEFFGANKQAEINKCKI